jgi:hypothetical protein
MRYSLHDILILRRVGWQERETLSPNRRGLRGLRLLQLGCLGGVMFEMGAVDEAAAFGADQSPGRI